MHALLQDLRYAARSLRKNPGFTVVAVLTLALGMGATSAIFSVVNAVLLRPLPYAEPQRLARIYTEFPTFADGGLRRFAVSPPEFLDLRRTVKQWESIDAWLNAGVNVAGRGEPVRVTASYISGGLLGTLGVAPVAGRPVGPTDDDPSAPLVANVSYGLWQSAFGGDRSLLGGEILVNGVKCTVIGVMPEGFCFPPDDTSPPDLWLPGRLGPGDESTRGSHVVNVVGRLRPGVSLEQGRAELNSLTKFWSEQSAAGSHHFDPETHTLVTYGLHDEVVRGVRPALRMLLGAVCFVLLIACVNVANLLLVRADARQRETGIRGALGAGLQRMATQFVTEGLLLSLLGGAVGLALAASAVEVIRTAGGASIPRAAEIRLDTRAFLFAALVCGATGIVFGLTPLSHVARQKLYDALKSGAASTTVPGATQRFRQALVAGELALTLMLLVGTGLMVRAFWKLQRVDAGFDPVGVVTAAIALPEQAYPRPEIVTGFWRRLEERMEALSPGGAAALCTSLPPVCRPVYSDTQIDGYVDAPGKPPQNVQYFQYVTPRYFDAMHIRIAEGRLFDRRDVAGAPAVAVINQTMARTFWGNRSALGGRVRPVGVETWYTVVGVIADVKNAGVENPTGTELYLPLDQVQTEEASFVRNACIVLRSGGPPATAISGLRREVAVLDPSLPLADVRTMDDVVAAARSRPRFLAMLLTLFSGAALALAAVGLYGVISYAVAQRTREFGVRLTLGARPVQILGSVLTRAALMTLSGLACGLAGAVALTQLISGLLYGITASDPATFAGVSLLLACVALLASYVAARRATRIDPMAALRYE